MKEQKNQCMNLDFSFSFSLSPLTYVQVAHLATKRLSMVIWSDFLRLNLTACPPLQSQVSQVVRAQFNGWCCLEGVSNFSDCEWNSFRLFCRYDSTNWWRDWDGWTSSDGVEIWSAGQKQRWPADSTRIQSSPTTRPQSGPTQTLCQKLPSTLRYGSGS